MLRLLARPMMGPSMGDPPSQADQPGVCLRMRPLLSGCAILPHRKGIDRPCAISGGISSDVFPMSSFSVSRQRGAASLLRPGGIPRQSKLNGSNQASLAATRPSPGISGTSRRCRPASRWAGEGWRRLSGARKWEEPRTSGGNPLSTRSLLSRCTQMRYIRPVGCECKRPVTPVS